MLKLYTEHEGRVVSADSRFKHVMAVALDPRTQYREGVIRCITSREGDIAMKGTIDRSELHKVKGESFEFYEVGEKLNIKNESEIIEEISDKGFECIGFEDPDIWIDGKTDLMHLYFTLPIINEAEGDKSKIHLGHAVGKNLNSLEMTMPVLMADERGGAKELAVAPPNRQGVRYNLVESTDKVGDTTYSVVRVAIAEDMGGPWRFGEIAFHPAEHSLSWIAGHASPGPLFSKNFIDIGDGKLLGIMNGCVANKKIGGKTKYGTFSVGLFIYDYENGEIDWVSSEPLVQDSEAGKGRNRAITFASQFVETGEGEGILYAHVDDSFVRAYTLRADLLKEILPINTSSS
ncbi:MAG: hypothetical protein A3H60_00995 [Candidatus Zambryskibacteria bacterium RIFCSPLOWO2_02_FULL_44_12b]|uniref:Uncharacterized protein n=2 Tax=Candidatus Zambryskiibacteriota TaxID=1817925 RepID=A0A1G2UML2_9BACT|nr:MAG: hypothetical protein A3H60_00995 [Candidatus Zambryskibacteria bacterium RIFCSPLOWO2_02_FULL_44_12b]